MNMSRRDVFGAGAAGIAATLPFAARSAAAPGERPNILWFTSEDNHPVIGAYGDTRARTPTIDLLARHGILYERCYCASPVCGPSRFSILTGMHPASAGSPADFGSTSEVLPGYIKGYPQYFRELGYYTANNQKKNYNSQFDYVMDMWDESGQKAHWNKRAPNQPFFAVFNTFTTHESTLFDGKKNLFGEPAAQGPFSPEMMADKIPPYLPDSPGVRKDFASFYNAMYNMDRELAFRLKEVADAGLSDDTIVFYYGDNGGITPRGKRYCYDLGLRVPLVVYIPPKWAHLSPHAPGTVVKEPVTFNDLMPTVLSLVGIPTPKHVHGRALLGPHKGAPQKYALGGRNRMDERYDFVRTVTDGHYRYIRNYSPHRIWGQHVEFMFQASGYQDWEALHLAGKLNPVQERFWQTKPYEELYDSFADPHMVNNLAEDPAHRAKLDELRHALDEQMVWINDNGFIPEACEASGYVNSRAPGGYPLREVIALAGRAASRDASALPDFVKYLKHDNEVLRYWGAQGLLIAGEAARPHVATMKAALLDERSVATRISLAEALVNLVNDHDALVTLGTIIDVDPHGPLRLQALNALTYVGEKARPVIPAIMRSSGEDHRGVRKLAKYILARLNGTYDPYKVDKSPGGYIFSDPEHETAPGNGRPYD